jgi:hypothetical protein
MERSNNLMVRRRKSCLQNITTRFVCEMARNIPIVFMKLVKEKNGSEPKMPQRMCHLKNNQFFYRYLPYWKELEICHAIDTLQGGVFEKHH